MDVINTSISHHFPTGSRSIRPGLPFVMVIADTALVEGLLGSILDQSRWCITNLHTIVVWASNNVFPLQTGHAAEYNDDKHDDEEEEQQEEDPLVAMEEGLRVASTGEPAALQDMKVIVGKGWTPWAQKILRPYIVQTTWLDNKQVTMYISHPR